jgi:hypothetical protein
MKLEVFDSSEVAVNRYRELETHPGAATIAMVRKAKEKGLVNSGQAQAPAPKAIAFPRLSEKSRVRCHTFLEDQVLLLSVRP